MKSTRSSSVQYSYMVRTGPRFNSTLGPGPRCRYAHMPRSTSYIGRKKMALLVSMKRASLKSVSMNSWRNSREMSRLRVQLLNCLSIPLERMRLALLIVKSRGRTKSSRHILQTATSPNFKKIMLCIRPLIKFKFLSKKTSKTKLYNKSMPKILKLSRPR